jgi:primase-polymerase (primpol)-like protein
MIRALYKGDDFASIDVVNWGSNDDPKGLLVEKREYEVLREEVHSWHTKLILKDFPNKKFNSVSFEYQ